MLKFAYILTVIAIFPVKTGFILLFYWVNYSMLLQVSLILIIYSIESTRRPWLRWAVQWSRLWWAMKTSACLTCWPPKTICSWLPDPSSSDSSLKWAVFKSFSWSFYLFLNVNICSVLFLKWTLLGRIKKIFPHIFTK